MFSDRGFYRKHQLRITSVHRQKMPRDDLLTRNPAFRAFAPSCASFVPEAKNGRLRLGDQKWRWIRAVLLVLLVDGVMVHIGSIWFSYVHILAGWFDTSEGWNYQTRSNKYAEVLLILLGPWYPPSISSMVQGSVCTHQAHPREPMGSSVSGAVVFFTTKLV